MRLKAQGIDAYVLLHPDDGDDGAAVGEAPDGELSAAPDSAPAADPNGMPDAVPDPV